MSGECEVIQLSGSRSKRGADNAGRGGDTGIETKSVDIWVPLEKLRTDYILLFLSSFGAIKRKQTN